MSYDFSKLNDREFEALGASIIERGYGMNVETFKSGKDGGVDGRFWIDNDEGVIQCKHWLKTPYSTLISKLKDEEKAKVEKLSPKRYIFVTSKELSRVNKQEIKAIFEPFILRDDDIWGYEDLNSFLEKKENFDVVERHYKLWINSSNVLKVLMNAAIKGRSKSTLEDIKKHSAKYAVTNNHILGRQILDQKNVVIISGEPGIGKTTLADNLALEYVAKEYEFCDIEESISEAESIFNEKEGRLILFYYDDFLGSNIYDAINNSKDSHIVKFINRVKKDKNSKFILTSRTSILTKAHSQSSSFENHKIRENEFVLTVKKLTDLDKALILYNQLYYSSLEPEFIDQIYEAKRYKKIIEHQNFNPRVVEFITDSQRLNNINSSEYWNYILSSLNNPSEIWRSHFQNQTDGHMRALVLLTVFNNSRIDENLLRKAYNTFLKLRPITSGDHADNSFDSVRRLVVGSWLNRTKLDNGTFTYTLFNPSITDFILQTYASETDLVADILQSLETEISLEFVKNLSYPFSGELIKPKEIDSIQTKLFDFFYKDKLKVKNWDFMIMLAKLNPFTGACENLIEGFLREVIREENPSLTKISELFSLLAYSGLEIEDFNFLVHLLNEPLGEVELKELTDLIVECNVEDEAVLLLTKNLIESFLEDLFSDENNLDIDFNKHIYYEHYSEHEYEQVINTDGIENEIHECIDAQLKEFNSDALTILDIDSTAIFESHDANRMAQSFLESLEPDFNDHDSVGSYTSYDSGDDIDAVFER